MIKSLRDVSSFIPSVSNFIEMIIKERMKGDVYQRLVARQRIFSIPLGMTKFHAMVCRQGC
jgi:hypothetical protein